MSHHPITAVVAGIRALRLERCSANFPTNSWQKSMAYLVNKKANVEFLSGKNEKEKIDISIFEKALDETHLVIEKITKDIPIDVFSVLGMRNLSAFIGELYAKSLILAAKGKFAGNPHQDGYPDLLLMNTGGKAAFERLRELGKLRDKAPFSPFEYGGIEVKATCGSVPTPQACIKKGLLKPGMGETRIDLLTGYDWKAHHRETNNLIGIFWDFQDGIPHIISVFFGNNLTQEDWGKIVQPKDGGGRTTSVSIMSRAGVAKMYNNWIIIKDDARYINFFNKYNKEKLIS